MTKQLLGLVLALAAMAAAAEPLPVEQFFKQANFSQLKLSPDGKNVAGVVRGTKRDGLAVVNIDTRGGRPITNFADADVLQFYWINDHRLVFSVGDAHEATSNAYYYGWYAVNSDGSQLEEISTQPKSTNYVGYDPRPRIRYLAPLPDGSDDILVEATLGNKDSVWRWNTL